MTFSAPECHRRGPRGVLPQGYGNRPGSRRFTAIGVRLGPTGNGTSGPRGFAIAVRGRRTAQRCGNTPHLRQSRQRYPHVAVSLGICRPKYRTRREVSGCGVGPASQRLPFPAAKSDAGRVGHTVPARKRCRTRGEVLAYHAGSLTVPEGKPYRPRGEALPYRWGTLTVLRGKFLRDFSCKLRKKLRKKRLHLFMLVH